MGKPPPRSTSWRGPRSYALWALSGRPRSIGPTMVGAWRGKRDLFTSLPSPEKDGRNSPRPSVRKPWTPGIGLLARPGLELATPRPVAEPVRPPNTPVRIESSQMTTSPRVSPRVWDRPKPSQTVADQRSRTWRSAGSVPKSRSCRHFLRAEEGTRTPDLPLTRRLLYQLSYFGRIRRSRARAGASSGVSCRRSIDPYRAHRAPAVQAPGVGTVRR